MLEEILEWLFGGDPFGRVDVWIDQPDGRTIMPPVNP